MSSSVTSSLSALATSPSDASYVPPPVSSAHRNRTLDNITQPPQPHRHGSQAHAAIEQIRVLLAYSGGPKCSCVLRWLLNTGYEVYVMIADLGGVEEDILAAARDRALRIGARKVFVEDLRQDFLNQFVYQSIRANALYEGRLPLGLALSRPCIARRQVEIARREQCPYVAHGALNLNSDHCRFELAYYALDPNIKIVAPTRDRRLLEIARTEDELHRYLSENNMYFVLGEKEREGVHTGAGTSAGEMEAAQNQNHMLQKLAAHGSFNIFTRTHTVNDDPSNPIGMAPRTVGLGDEGATEGGGMDSSVLGGHCLSTYDAGGSTHSSAAVVAATSLAPHNIKPEPSITGACGNRAQAPNSLLWTINPSLVSEAMDQPDYLCISFHAGRLRSVYWYGRNEEPKIHIALEALGLIPSKKSSTASGITVGIGGDTGLCVTVSAGRRGTSAPRSELSGGTVAGFYTEQELTGGSNPHNHKGSTIPTSTSALDPTAPINMSISPTSMLGGELNASSSISDAATNIGQNINAHPSFHPTFLHHPHPSASDNVTSIYHPLSHFVSGSTNCEDVLASLGYRTYTTNTHPSIRMFELLNYIGARQGVGRIDMVANAQIGVKSRYFVECPGGTILFRAHEDLEGYVLDREVRRLRDMITPKFSELVYNGFWYSPEMEFVSAAVGNSQEVVEGAVLVRVYRGSVLPLDRFSPRTVCGHGGLASDIIATKHLHCVSPQSEQKMTHPSFTQVHHCPEDVAGYVRCASSRLKTASLEKKAFA